MFQVARICFIVDVYLSKDFCYDIRVICFLFDFSLTELRLPLHPQYTKPLYIRESTTFDQYIMEYAAESDENRVC